MVTFALELLFWNFGLGTLISQLRHFCFGTFVLELLFGNANLAIAALFLTLLFGGLLFWSFCLGTFVFELFVLNL